MKHLKKVFFWFLVALALFTVCGFFIAPPVMKSIDVDDVKIGQPEYEKYLRLAYKAEKFAKPRNMLGLEKTIPVPEMEKLMLTNTIVTEDDLRALARRRASRVMETLLKTSQIQAGRLFIVEAKSLTPPKNAKVKESRVEFKLK